MFTGCVTLVYVNFVVLFDLVVLFMLLHGLLCLLFVCSFCLVVVVWVFICVLDVCCVGVIGLLVDCLVLLFWFGIVVYVTLFDLVFSCCLVGWFVWFTRCYGCMVWTIGLVFLLACAGLAGCLMWICLITCWLVFMLDIWVFVFWVVIWFVFSLAGLGWFVLQLFDCCLDV